MTLHYCAFGEFNRPPVRWRIGCASDYHGRCPHYKPRPAPELPRQVWGNEFGPAWATNHPLALRVLDVLGRNIHLVRRMPFDKEKRDLG
jgi:hypothetical protein